LNLSSASVAAIASLENPTGIIARYLYDTMTALPEFSEYSNLADENGIRIIPVVPTSPYPAGAVGPLLLDPLTNPDQFLITYDDFIRARSGAGRNFYPVKSIQSRIKVSMSDFSKMLLFRNRAIQLLDRCDVSAQEVNNWINVNTPGDRIFFHSIDAYQSVYMSDATNLDDQRNVFSGDIIVRADYHINGSYN
jgi:hypothetical protein